MEWAPTERSQHARQARRVHRDLHLENLEGFLRSAHQDAGKVRVAEVTIKEAGAREGLELYKRLGVHHLPLSSHIKKLNYPALK